MKTMRAAEFKAKCLAILDEVDSTGEAVLITKRGKPVARLISLKDGEYRETGGDSIFGFMRGMGTIAKGLIPSEFTKEEWDRMENGKWARFEMGAPR